MNKVSVIIINYNTFRVTSDCIQAVIDKTRGIAYEIILVDNASTECDPALFVKSFPEIQLVRSEVNGGFASGNNLGISKASGDYILLLNSDTLLQEDSLTKCLEYFRAEEKTGVLGCKMIFPSGKVQYTARRFRSIQWELLDLFRFIPYLMSYQKRSRLMLGRYFRHDENREAEWLNGAFFMFPRKIMEQLPQQKLDDRFFMYGEDQLWCEQIRNLGYKIQFFAGTSIVHINGGSSDVTKIGSVHRAMIKHELEIMRLRKGKGLYYSFFKLIYVSKEGTRNVLKSIASRLSGRVIR